MDQELLPALEKKDVVTAEAAYAKFAAPCAAHRAVIDDVVKQATDENTAPEAKAAEKVTQLSYLVWAVSAVVIIIIALRIFGIAFGSSAPSGE